MTYQELQEFTKQVVLKYLRQIVTAEDQTRPYPEELSQIARGLNFPCCTLFVNVLRDTYRITISI